MNDRTVYTEITMQIGEAIRVGDTVVSIIETQENQAAVLVEELSVIDQSGSETPLSTSQPQ